MTAMLTQSKKTAFVFLGLLALFLTTAVAGTNISHTPDESWQPRITVDTIGNVYVCWLDKYSDTTGDIFYARFDKASQTWSTAKNLSQSGNAASPMNDSARACDITSDDSNRVYVVWVENSVIKLKTYSGGTWDAAYQVNGGSGTDCPRIACDSAGNLFVCWWYTSGQVYSRARINGNWEASKLISNRSKRAKVPDIGAGSNSVYCVWMEKQPDDYRTAYVQRNKSFNATWSTVAEVYHGPVPHSYSTVKVDASEGVHVMYLEEQAEGIRTAMYSYKSGSGGFSTPIAISKTATLHYPASAVKSASFYPCWQMGGWGNGQAIQYNSKIGGSWSGTVNVPQSNGCTYGDISVGPDGKIHIVWENAGEIYYQLMGGSEPPPPPPPPPPPVNKPPVADFNFNYSGYPNPGWAPLTVQFDGRLSVDPDGAIASWDWVFGDGTTDSGPNPLHAFQNRGTYSVKLTVLDNSGAKDSKIKTVEVRGLYPPKNVSWEWVTDQSLFQVRYGYKVTWAANPANDSIATITKYRVWRRNEGDDNWKLLGDVQASAPLQYNDLGLKLEDRDNFVYSAQAVDAQGHVSEVGAKAQSVGLAPAGPIRVINSPTRIIKR
jgi:PKD repeat protein